MLVPMGVGRLRKLSTVSWTVKSRDHGAAQMPKRVMWRVAQYQLHTYTCTGFCTGFRVTGRDKLGGEGLGDAM